MVMGFLNEITLIGAYRGEKSGVKEMPGGGSQGTTLRRFLFLVLISDAHSSFSTAVSLGEMYPFGPVQLK